MSTPICSIPALEGIFEHGRSFKHGESSSRLGNAARLKDRFNCLRSCSQTWFAGKCFSFIADFPTKTSSSSIFQPATFGYQRVLRMSITLPGHCVRGSNHHTSLGSIKGTSNTKSTDGCAFLRDKIFPRLHPRRRCAETKSFDSDGFSISKPKQQNHWIQYLQSKTG